MATDKLGLPSAGRRVFLDDGTEVFTPREIYRDSEVYISCGEPFKDPLRPVKSKNWIRSDPLKVRVGYAQTRQKYEVGPLRPLKL